MIEFKGHKTSGGIGVILKLFDTREAAKTAFGKDCAVIGIGPGFAYLGEGGAYFDEQGMIPDWWALDDSLRNHDGEPDATHFRLGDWWVSPAGTRYQVVDTYTHKESRFKMVCVKKPAGKRQWREWDKIGARNSRPWFREAWGGAD